LSAGSFAWFPLGSLNFFFFVFARTALSVEINEISDVTGNDMPTA